MPEGARVCAVEDCIRAHYGKGYCYAHFQRVRDGRDLAKPIRARRITNHLCPAGHDKRVVGRKVGGACVECARLRDRGRKRKQTTGWTQAEFDAALKEQNGCCAICGRSDIGLRADHCHETGRKRGLLCIVCNGTVEPAITRYVTDPEFRARWNAYLGLVFP